MFAEEKIRVRVAIPVITADVTIFPGKSQKITHPINASNTKNNGTPSKQF